MVLNGQNGLKRSKIVKMVKMVQKFEINPKYGPNWSKMSNMVRYCPKLFKMVLKKFKWSKIFQFFSKMIQIHLKFFLKTTAVGATAVGVTAVRNNLIF